MVLLTFSQALDKARSFSSNLALLLGNGFSRACRDDIFSYDSIFRSADFSALSPCVKSSFSALNTTDFETLMGSLENAAKLISLYIKDKTLSEATKSQMEEDARKLKEVLAKTLAQNHPDQPNAIPASAYEACQNFLNNFEKIYTVNYDLLLYWTIMHEHEKTPNKKFDDGFRYSGSENEYVTWEVQNTNRQRLFYLHGALHIYDAGHEVKKFTWVNTGIPLIKQIHEALSVNYFPLIVAEGKSKQKLQRIQHSSFLGRAYRSFANIQCPLFIFGHSMSEKDQHILQLIQDGKIGEIFVGIFGDIQKEENQKIIAKGESMKLSRRTKKPLNITYYNASSTNVWGS
jgi:hypothetical protein